MFNRITDQHVLLPIVKWLGVWNKVMAFTPNTITLFNGFIITPLLILSIIHKNVPTSFLCAYVRCVLDGLDGYWARKTDSVTHLGEIYDHSFDNILIFTAIFMILSKTVPGKYRPLYFYMGMVSITYISFTPNTPVSDIVYRLIGNGGGYDGFCTVINCIGAILLATI